MTKHDIKPGQTVYVKMWGHCMKRCGDILEAKVAKVGRKFFTLENKHPFYDDRVYLDTMLHDAGQYSAKYKVYLSKQEILDEKEAQELHDRIRRIFERHSALKVTLEQLRAINTILGGATDDCD